VLAGLPLSVLTGFLLSDVTRALRERARSRRATLSNAVDEALSALAKAESARDRSRVASAAEKAVFAAIERATTIRGRGLLKADLARVLAEASVPATLAERTARVLERCDGLRFAGEDEDVASLAADARGVVSELGRLRPAKLSGS
jgi:hypothetical protein